MLPKTFRVPLAVHPNIPLLAIFNFCLDFKLFAPIAILFFAEVSGSFTLGMSVFSVTYISSALFEVPTGVLSDIVGRKRTSILGAVFSLLSVVMLALATNYLMLVAASILAGISQSFFSGNDEALLYESLEDVGQEKEFAQYLGKTSSMFQVALAISALLGGVTATVSLRLPVILSIIPQIILVVVALGFINPTRHTDEAANIFSHLKEAIVLFVKNHKLRWLSISSMLGFAVSEPMYVFRSAFVALLWPVWAIGAVGTLANVGAAGGFYISGPLLKKVSPLKFLVGASIFARVTNFLALLFPGVLSPLLLASSSLTHGSGTVARSTLMQEHFSKEKRATMGSLNSFGGSLLVGLASLLIGAAADQWGPIVALLLGNIFLLPLIPIYLHLFANDKQ